MVICAYGAGSVGCYIGGRLAATGTEVVFIGRERVAGQIAGHGLTLTDWRGSEMRVPSPRFETDPDAVSEADLVLVTVKSTATATAGDELAPRLKTGAIVISFQNGLHNTELLRERLPGTTVLPGMVAFNVVNRGEGRFHDATAGELEVQSHVGLAEAAEAFERAGFPLVQREDMAGVQIAKLLLNLNNPINALSGQSLRDELSRRPFRRCLAMAQREALAAYAAAGLKPVKHTPIPPEWLPALLTVPDAVFKRVFGRMLAIDPLARSSMWDDLQAGRPTEIDYLNGEIVALAREHGTRAPVNERLVDLLHEAESGELRTWTGPELLAELTRSLHR